MPLTTRYAGLTSHSFALAVVFLGVLLLASFVTIARADTDGAAVPVATGMMEMKPATGDTHHLEVKIETVEGFRIPDMKIVLQAVPEGGGETIEKELEGMFGSNYHYGVNIALEPKKYLLKFHIEPPTFMREGKRASQWQDAIDAEFNFDARTSATMSGMIGTQDFPDMKLIVESEEAETMYVLPKSGDAHMMAESMHSRDDAEVPTASSTSALPVVVGLLGIAVGVMIGRSAFGPKA